ncbi:MAG TPA: pyridoxine 5'-phosphate synthase [Thermoanaerobaculia bacterium]|nr:pyridoxine 5'-phosphate synthase [Thermoanaerobaculia bacterium]
MAAASAVRLSVNVDHVATLRQARRAPYPDPVEAARMAEDAGASGITVHLRGDRRHIQDADVQRLRTSVRGKLNLEMSVAVEMLQVAGAVRPDQVTLVPERPDEVTTEGGLDLAHQFGHVAAAAERLARGGIAVSAFVDPDPGGIEALAAIARNGGGGPGKRPGLPLTIAGVELNTDSYTRATLIGGEMAERELAKVRAAAAVALACGFRLYAGHGLTTANVGPIAALPGMEELNIGHALIARAVLVGIPAAVKEMLAAMAG